MPPTDPPIDATPILAQPREFADRLARVERERAELIETVARLRAECNDAQAVARAYILRAERTEMDANKWAILANGRANALDAASAEVARLTALVEKLQIERLDRLADNVAELDQQERAALRQPAPAQAWCNCGMGDGTMPELHSPWCAVQEPAPAGGETGGPHVD